MLKFNFRRFIELHHQHWKLKYLAFSNSLIHMIVVFFSIANVVEFCFKPDCFNTRVTYSTSKMREHLIHCLESGNMTPFPKEKVRGRCKLDSITCKVFKIPIWCICKMPECIDNMICCDNRKCRTWFHRKCLNIDSQRNEWQCPSCEIQND